MLRIGDFSKLSRVSIRMLRHYDELGLLQPAQTDTFTGYRYYEEEQLITIGRICSLKEIGFSLTDIRKILEIYDDRPQMESFFEARERELLRIQDETARQMMLLETVRKRLREEQIMKYDVTIKTIPERYAATLHMTIPHYDDEGMVWQVLCEETEPLHMTEAAPCLIAVEYLDDEYKEENVELIAWKTVKGQYRDTEHVKFKTLPEVTVASTVMKGGYDQIGDAYAAVISWIKENGYESSGPMFNIYHVSPHESQNPEEFITEICYPVKQAK